MAAVTGGDLVSHFPLSGSEALDPTFSDRSSASCDYRVVQCYACPIPKPFSRVGMKVYSAALSHHLASGMALVLPPRAWILSVACRYLLI